MNWKRILLALSLIAAWCAVTYFFYWVLSNGFHWTALFYIPMYLFISYFTVYAGGGLLLEELKRRHE